MALADKGIDIRLDNAQLLIRAALTDADGAIVTTGTCTVRIYEVQADGTLFGYDFASPYDFSADPATPTGTPVHRQVNSVDSGIWTLAVTNITDFTDSGIYIVRVSNTTAVPDEQFREFQWDGEAVGMRGTDGGATEAKQDIIDGIVDNILVDTSTTNYQEALAARYGVPVGNVFHVEADNGSDDYDGLTPAKAVASLRKLLYYDGDGLIYSVAGPVVILVLSDVQLDAAGQWVHRIQQRGDVRLIGVNYPLLYDDTGACTLNVSGQGLIYGRSQNVEITGFRIQRLAGSYGIDVMDSGAWIHHNIFEGDVSGANGADIAIDGKSWMPIRDIRIENNILHGHDVDDPWGSIDGDYGVRIGVANAVEGVIVRNNEIHNRKAFVSFEKATDCYSYNNQFFNHVSGRDAINVTGDATTCYSIDDKLDGDVPGVTSGKEAFLASFSRETADDALAALSLDSVAANLVKVLAKAAGKGTVTDQSPTNHVTDYYEEDGVTKSHTETVKKTGRTIS